MSGVRFGGKRVVWAGGVLTTLLLLLAAGPRLSVWAQSIFAEAEEEEEGSIQKRAEWFYSQRAFPYRYVPGGAHVQAVAQLEQKVAFERLLRARPGDSEGALQDVASAVAAQSVSWTFIGPQPSHTPYTALQVSGRVAALAVDPADANVVYLGAAQGGVWKTTDGGANWTPLTDQGASLAVGSLALDPQDSNRIYAGTGEQNFSGDSYYGAGILRSTNGGTTWAHLCGPFCGPVDGNSYWGGGARIGALAVSPSNGQILLAGVQLLNKDGIYRSINSGQAWTRVLAGDPGTAVLFDPVDGNIAYAALGAYGGTTGVYKSSDGGSTWSAVNSGLNLSGAGRIVLAISASNTAVLYASIANRSTGGLNGVFKTTNRGASWTRLVNVPAYCSAQCWYDNVLAVQPTNPNVVYAGGAFTTTLVRSLDGGSTWATLQAAATGSTVHADLHALTFSADGARLYVGSDGGPYSTTQVTAPAPAFTPLNATLGTHQFYPGLAIHPTDKTIAIGGTQDNGTIVYSGALEWNQVTCGDGGYSLIDTVTPTTMYTSCQNVDIQKSTAGGAFGSWSSADSGVNTGDRGLFIPPLVMDTSAPNNLYFGTYRVYRTINGATTWKAISGDLTTGYGSVSTIAVAPTNSNVVYAGTSDGRVQVTTNALAASVAWANRSAGLPVRFLTQVAVDPTNANKAYATFSGFKGFGNSLGHVFRTTNAGVTWTDISVALPNTPVNAIAIYPNAPGTLFIGTDVGVFYSTNSGSTWTSLVGGLPRVAVLALALHYPSHTLRATTHGRSVWDLDVSSLVPVTIASITPKNAAVGAADFTLTVAGGNFTASSVVRWNGTDLPTTFVSRTKLTAAVSTSHLAGVATIPVTVYDGFLGVSSNASNFAVQGAPTLQWSTAAYAVAESAGQRTVTVTRTGWSGATATVHYATSNGSAAVTKDYQPASGTLSFTVGVTSRTFSVPILEDALVEGLEAANLTLSAPTGAPLGATSAATLKITDNDGSAVYFTGTKGTVSEAGGTWTAVLQRSGPLSAAATVKISTVPLTATSLDGDYGEITSQTVTFGAGVGSANVPVTINEDALVEGSETFRLQLSAPTGAVLGTQKTVTVTITDND